VCPHANLEPNPDLEKQKTRNFENKFFRLLWASIPPTLRPVSYQVFARKYRPKTFDDVLGQDHVVRTLRNAIEQNRLAHAYLFVGPRGTGKTSTARIFAKALNCTGGPKVDFDPDEDICQEIAEGRSLDVLEIDGASNRGIDEIRQLRETVQYAPARGRFKIYYIDEVHMLTKEAFNALLKTLEEPPEHVKFIFATTEPEKILATILSRCQRFDLRPIPAPLIAEHLTNMAKQEGLDLDPAAAWAIARGADGGMRDAQSMLDQLVSFCGETITESNVLDVFGFTSRETVAELLGALFSRDTPTALHLVERESKAGRELGQLLSDVVDTLRSLLVWKVDPQSGAEGMPADIWERLTASAKPVATERILAVVDVFSETEARMRWATHKRLHFEIGLMKAVQTLGEVQLSDVIKTIANATSTGVLTTEAPPSPAKPDPAPATKKTDPVPAKPDPAPKPTAEPTPKPAQKSTPEPPAQPAPEKPAPAPAAKSPEPAPKPPPGSKLNALLESAPDEDPDPPPKPKPTPKKQKEDPKPEPPTLPHDFHDDPLVNKALELFKGKIVK